MAADGRRIVPDKVIAQTFVRELKRDTLLAREPIQVKVDVGVVTLQGSVSNRLAQDRAVATLHVVRGARAIINQLSVLRRPRTDAELEVAIAAALESDPAVAEQPIGARAHAGVVRLTGEVDSNAAKQIAQNDVLGIPGVLDVVNDAVVQVRERSDAQLGEQAARLLREDPWVDASRVKVTTADGVVALSGRIPSAPERARAEADVWKATPLAVVAADLHIDRWTDDGTIRAEPAAFRSDRDLAQALADAFQRDSRVYPFAPHVSVRHGVVILQGAASDDRTRAAAASDAFNLPGVASVRDEVARPTDEGMPNARDRMAIEGVTAPPRTTAPPHMGVTAPQGATPR